MKKHCNKAIQALHDEFLQSRDMGVLKPIKRSYVTRKKIRDALRAMLVFKDERDGSLKGKTCADGRKQRE